MGKFIDLTGKIYGRLTVISLKSSYRGYTTWSCKCACGTRKDIAARHLRSGATVSCGCRRKEVGSEKKLRLKKGQKFGHLTVISEVLDAKDDKSKWLCRCVCGDTTVANGTDLKNGGRTLCDRTARKWGFHGVTGERLYNIWQKMMKRCENKNDISYKNYGGREIKVCKRWKKFENFVADLKKSHDDHVIAFGEKDTTIERIDNDGNYEPSNVRWATKAEQAKNKRKKYNLTKKK